jgi:protocatechuate 3,4-dioxygenase beta subunit/tetratricopeptide (TPR) repeat protein
VSGALRWKFRPSENSEIDSNLATDGKRLFVTTRPTNDGAGETAIFALGPAPGEPAKEKQAAADETAVDETDKEYTAPITVSGRTLDRDGNLIAGASVYLAAYTPGYRRLAETKSDELGVYTFENVKLPIKRSDVVGGEDSGGFEVFGFADGHAIAWRSQKWFYPKSPHYSHEQLDESVERPHAFGAQDPIKLDLTFGPPATVRGRIVDDRGNPIPNVLLDIRYADSEWNRAEFNSHSFTGALSSFNEREIVPRDFKTKNTDEDGRFEFTGLPFDHRFSIWVHAPGFPLELVWAVTNDTLDAESKGPNVYNGEINLALKTPRDVPVQIVYGDTGEPAQKVHVSAGGSSGTTDINGRVNLRLPGGEYRIHLLQRINTPYRPTESDITVTEESVKQPAQVKLQPAGVVDISVVDADTSAPLEGVDVWRQEVTPPNPPYRTVYGYRSWEVETRISHYEQPRTGDDGKVRVMFDPGKHVIGVGHEAYPAGYTPVEPDSKVIDVQPGEPHAVEFQLRKLDGSKKDTANEDRLVLFPLSQPAGATDVSAQTVIPRPVPNSMSGQAVDERQQPIAGAKASLFRVNRHDGSHKLLAEQVTDPDGRFQFHDVIDIDKEFVDDRIPSLDDVGDDFLQVAIRDQGRVSESWLELPQRVAKDGTFNQVHLAPAAALAGRVTGPDGKPVEGALVSIGAGSFDRWEGMKADRTDEGGNYEINDVAPFGIAEYRTQQLEQRRRMEQQRSRDAFYYSVFSAPPVLAVEHPNFAVKKVGYERIPGNKNVQLEPPATLEGRVVDEVTGKPAAGAIVRAMTSRTSDRLPTADAVYDHHSAVAHTGADGKYRLTTLPAGTYDIAAEAPGRLNAGQSRIEAMVGRATTVPDLKLVSGVPVRIRLVEKGTREPIELPPDTRATVGAQPLRNGWSIGLGKTITVSPDSDGKFEIAALPGENHLWVGSVLIDDNVKWGGIEPVQVNVTAGQENDVDVPVVDVTAAQPTGVVSIAPASPPPKTNSKEARDEATASLAKNPNDYDALLRRAMALQQMGEYEKAAADYENMIRLNPPGARNVLAHNNLAFLLATAPDDDIRNGKRAVELAKRATELRPSMPDTLDTLAAAYAESGDFDKAIETQKKAIELHPDHAYFREHLRLYEAKQPLREKPPAEAADASANDDGAATEEPINVTVVVAEHGIIHDGRIIEWADLEKLVTAHPNSKRVHPVFRWTARGAEVHQEEIRAKIWDFRKRVPLHGHTWSSVAPEDYQRYDTIRAAGGAD